MHAQQLETVLQRIEELQLLKNARRVQDTALPGYAMLEGEIAVEGRTATLRLVLGESFPLQLPLFFLRPWDALGFIPHVEASFGQICYLDAEGMVLDQHRPVALICDALQRTLKTLTDGIKGRNQVDFVDEFEVYWQRLPGVATVYNILDPLEQVIEVTVVSKQNGDVWITTNEADIAAFSNHPGRSATKRWQQALYIPLEPNTIIVPPRSDRAFWSLNDIRKLCAHLNIQNQQRLRQLLKGRVRAREYVVFRLPHSLGGASLFGICFEGLGRYHPLHQRGTAKRLTPIALQRLERTYLVQRGGAAMNLSSKRMLLIGCGAVGGYLGLELARAGVGSLTFLDHDKLTKDNTFRHVLGRRYWGQNKAIALEHEVRAILPYVNVQSIPLSVEVALAQGQLNLANYDLIVVATGNPTIELMINERLHTLGSATCAIFTWTEPLGLGGHALLVNNSVAGGCFECLYTSPTDGYNLINRASFAGPGQSFGRALSGCGSLHTPYGSLDALQTAHLAARLAVDALTGKETGNPLCSWKGDATSFMEANFRVSERYEHTDSQLRHQRYSYQSVLCRICSSQR
jgi:molybdopterin-synthase adenylyltransferase